MNTNPETPPRPNSPSPPVHPTPKNKSSRGFTIAATLLALLAAGLFFRSRHSSTPAAPTETTTDASPDPIRVEVAPATQEPVESILTAQGTLVAAQGASAKVAVVAPGRLARVFVAEGDRVSAGQLVAVVDDRAANAGAQSAQADLSAAQADARSAELVARAAQTDQANALRQAQLGLASAMTERDGAVRQAQIALRTAQSDLRKTQVGARAGDVSNALQQARLALRAARVDRDAAVKTARNALASAQTDLTRLRAGARPQEIKQSQAALTQAQATRDRAVTEVDRVQYLFDKGIKARRDLDDAQTALKVAEAALKSAQDALSLLEAGTRPEEIRAGELKVEGAREDVASAQQSNDAKVAQAQSALLLAQNNLSQAAQQRPEDVGSARLRVAAATDALNQAQQSGAAKIAGARAALQAASQGNVQIAAKAQDARSKQAAAQGKQADLQAAQVTASTSELRAPLAGVISKRNLNPGDIADPAVPVVEISNADVLNMVANLPGDSGGDVQAGMLARISTSGVSARTVTGSVVSVGQIDPQTSLLAVRIAVPNPGGALKIGAFATARIVLTVKPLAVVVPLPAILSRDGKSVVMVAGSDGKAHQKDVTTGTERNGSIEVTSGLKAGERVIGAGAYQLDDGAPIEIVPKGTLPAGTSNDAGSTAGASDASKSGNGNVGAASASRAPDSGGTAGAAQGAGAATGASGAGGA